MNFVFVNIFYLNNVSFGVDNVKTINGTFSMLWLRIFQIMDKKYLYLFLSHLKILSQHILQKQSSQFLKIIYFDFCNFSLFARPDNPIDLDLKSCSKFEFYSSKSLKLQEDLNNVNRNTSLACFGMLQYFFECKRCLLCLLNKISDKIDSVALIKEIKIKNKHKNGLIMRLRDYKN